MHNKNDVVTEGTDHAALLGPSERAHLRERLEREREELERRLEREDVDLTSHLERVSERGPCAVMSPAAAAEDARQEIRSGQAREASRHLQEIEQGLRRLCEEPHRFGLCARCGQAISAARLDVLPFTTLCVRCAVDNR